MRQISLHQVLPQVFAQREDMVSDVWKTDVTFEQGKTCLVEAESGKGKSTFCSYLLGYRHDYTGTILFDADDVRRYTISQWVDVRQRHISLLFQEMRLFPELTAWENVEIKNRLTGHITKSDVLRWFEMLGIEEKLHVKAGLLSQGQQQRVAFIRALTQPSDFLVVDEPISHLDDVNAQLMADIVRQVKEQTQCGVIVTSIGKQLPLEYNTILKL
ncbi:MAG: ATP-binding cassette domain-containing protein [Prevotella sp.]|nr:ATP-binding cassette domain-containing protein [Prevotella sp.]